MKRTLVRRNRRSGTLKRSAAGVPRRIYLAQPFTLERILDCYRRLTGREPTSGEIEEARAMLNSAPVGAGEDESPDDRSVH